jgi:hypothetical protein
MVRQFSLCAYTVCTETGKWALMSSKCGIMEAGVCSD